MPRLPALKSATGVNDITLTNAEQASLQGLLASWQDWRLPNQTALTQAPSVIARLTGGSNHLTFKAAAGDQAFALRINQPHRRALAMGLKQELALLRLAGEHRLAPAIVFAQDDWLVTCFIEAPSWELQSDTALSSQFDSQLSSQLDQHIEPLAQQLRALHKLEVTDTGFDLLEHCRGYYAQIDEPSDAQQQLHQQLLALTTATLARFPARCLCHNDLNPGNIMLAPKPLLIDWEYATSNHPSFDLASLFEWGQLSPTQQQQLLDSYRQTDQLAFTSPECLQAFRLIVRYVEWLWLLQPVEQTKEQPREAFEADPQALPAGTVQICQQRLEQQLNTSRFKTPLY